MMVTSVSSMSASIGVFATKVREIMVSKKKLSVAMTTIPLVLPKK